MTISRFPNCSESNHIINKSDYESGQVNYIRENIASPSTWFLDWRLDAVRFLFLTIISTTRLLSQGREKRRKEEGKILFSRNPIMGRDLKNTQSQFRDLLCFASGAHVRSLFSEDRFTIFWTQRFFLIYLFPVKQNAKFSSNRRLSKMSLFCLEKYIFCLMRIDV